MLFSKKSFKLISQIIVFLLAMSLIAIYSCKNDQVVNPKKNDVITIESIWDVIVKICKVIVADASGAATGAGGAAKVGAGADGIIGAAIVVGVAASIVEGSSPLIRDNREDIEPGNSPYNIATNRIDSAGLMHNEIIIEIFQGGDTYFKPDSSYDFTIIYHYSLEYLQEAGYDSTSIKDAINLQDYLSHVSDFSELSSFDDYRDDVDNISELTSIGRAFLKDYITDMENSTTTNQFTLTASSYTSKLDTLSVQSDEKEILDYTMSVARYSTALWIKFDDE